MARPRKVNYVWRDKNRQGECFVYADLGTRRHAKTVTLGPCDNEIVNDFLVAFLTGVGLNLDENHVRWVQEQVRSGPDGDKKQDWSPRW